MTTLTPHPYAHILRAIADGQEVQWQENAGRWIDQHADETLWKIGNHEFQPARYRIKPRTIRIGEIDVPEPLREMPPDGTTVWWPGFGPDTSDGMTEYADADYQPQGMQYLLRRGLLHLTREAAETHAKALVAFTQKKEN